MGLSTAAVVSELHLQIVCYDQAGTPVCVDAARQVLSGDDSRYDCGAVVGEPLQAACRLPRRLLHRHRHAGRPGADGDAGNSGLSYAEGSDRYHVDWDTERSWWDTCRELVLRFADGSERTALFRFR